VVGGWRRWMDGCRCECECGECIEGPRVMLVGPLVMATRSSSPQGCMEGQEQVAGKSKVARLQNGRCDSQLFFGQHKLHSHISSLCEEGAAQPQVVLARPDGVFARDPQTRVRQSNRIRKDAAQGATPQAAHRRPGVPCCGASLPSSLVTSQLFVPVSCPCGAGGSGTHCVWWLGGACSDPTVASVLTLIVTVCLFLSSDYYRVWCCVTHALPI
jgi:hypothetical protein